MSFLSLLWVEIRRQLHNRAAWLLMLLTVLSPVAGYGLYRPALGDSMATLYLANPMAAGGVAGCILFAVLTAVSLDRPKRNGVASLTAAISSPLTMNAVRLASVIFLAVLSSLAVGILYLPYTAYKLDIVFSWMDYWLALWLIFLPGPVMGAICSCIVYQLVERLDVCLLSVLAFLLFSRSIHADEFLWQWSVPLVPALSDAFGSSLVWRTALYSHLTWLCLLGGLWIVSLLCVRQYGRGAAGSLLCQARRSAWKPITALLLAAAGGWLWYSQPFIDHSSANWAETGRADRMNEKLMLLETDLQLQIDSYILGILSGTAVFRLQNQSGQPQELYMELNPGYQLQSLTANGTPLSWDDLKNDTIAIRELHCTLPADAEITLEVNYKGSPRIWNVREYLLDGSVISGHNIALSSPHLAPTLRNGALIGENTKAHMQIALRRDLTMVTSGHTQMVRDNGDGTCEWSADAAGTNSFQVFAGDYVKMDLKGGGMPIEFYYSQKYQERLESMDAVTMMEEVIRYCTEHYGPRSFTEDEPFKIIQMTVFSFGGFAKNHISGMGETYFTDQNLNNKDKGPNSAEILAHEIVHQWWGLGAALMDPEDDTWSDEGITTYTTYRIMRERMGEEYAVQNYVKEWEADVEDNEKNFYLRHPEYLDRLPESYANDILAGCRAVNWYSGNALMMYRVSEMLGAEAVDQVWADLYRKCKDQEIPYITKRDFLDACGLSSDLDEQEIREQGISEEEIKHE